MLDELAAHLGESASSTIRMVILAVTLDDATGIADAARAHEQMMERTRLLGLFDILAEAARDAPAAELRKAVREVAEEAHYGGRPS
jgi:hypothetical protein